MKLKQEEAAIYAEVAIAGLGVSDAEEQVEEDTEQWLKLKSDRIVLI